MPKFNILLKLSTALPLLLALAPSAYAADPLTFLQEQGAQVRRDQRTDQVTFIGTGVQQAIPLPNPSLKPRNRSEGSNYTSYANPPAVANLDWDIKGVADFNKDGNPDIIWRNQANGINVIWNMNGDGSNYTSYINPPTVADTNWEIK